MMDLFFLPEKDFQSFLHITGAIWKGCHEQKLTVEEME